MQASFAQCTFEGCSSAAGPTGRCMEHRFVPRQCSMHMCTFPQLFGIFSSNITKISSVFAPGPFAMPMAFCATHHASFTGTVMQHDATASMPPQRAGAAGSTGLLPGWDGNDKQDEEEEEEDEFTHRKSRPPSPARKNAASLLASLSETHAVTQAQEAWQATVRRGPQACTFTGCNTPAKARGLCGRHGA